jgi:thiamine biosynthesis lipoprotein
LGAPPPGTKGWTVNIAASEPPDAKTPPKTLVLHHCGIATSGDAEQFIELEGTRYSNIVDPKTGVGLTSRIQATVIAPNGTDADALATAVCVLGVKKGIELIDGTVGTAARILVVSNAGPEEHFSREWKAMTGSGKAPEQATKRQ